MKQKLVIIDLDGTLIDTKDINYQAYKYALSKFGFSINYDYYCKYCNGRHYLDFLPSCATDDEKILSEIHKIKVQNYKNYIQNGRLNQSLVDLIKTLKKDYYVALVTTASSINCMQILNYFNIVSLFDLILTREDVEKSKPNPECFIKAIEHFGVHKNNTIVFEDTEVGETAAKLAGLDCVIVKGYN